jgi:hypothetical protein
MFLTPEFLRFKFNRDREGAVAKLARAVQAGDA